jgi:CRISPR-associated endonuclease/helicase Cas3
MFRAATGREPGEWLARVAREGLPAHVRLPAVHLASDVILAWLWQRLFASDNSNRRDVSGGNGNVSDDEVPRRLVYAMPQGSVVEPVVSDVRAWLDRLGLVDAVALHVAMGTWAESQGPDWREDMHRPAIIVGTSEVLVSKALMRGFGVGFTMWPIDFALVTNGAQWIVPDCPLSGQAVATLRRIESAARRYGTAEPLRVMEAEGEGEGRDVRKNGLAELGPGDLLGFFDTAPGAGRPVVELACEDPDLDVAVVWAAWTPGKGGAPDPEVRVPGTAYRCPLPLSSIGALARDRAVWRRGEDGTWARVADPSDVRPFELLLINAADGGCDVVTGHAPAVREPAAGCPVLRTPAELAALDEAAAAEVPERPWQSLDEHSAQVQDQAAALLEVLSPAISDSAWRSVVVAGWLHDVGKGHATWQDALCALAPASDRDMVAAGRPWAKSGTGAEGRLEFADEVRFRHELASLLLLDGPLRDLLALAPDQDLCRYLVLAHHGLLRMRVAGDGEPGCPSRVVLGLKHGATTQIPPMLGVGSSRLTVDLSQFGDEPGCPWREMVTALLARYGPFCLAYLEAVVRIADWRASGARELPG